MNSVIGLDISKGSSQTQAFLDKGRPFGKGFTVQHIRDGFENFLCFLRDIESEMGLRPTIILESTRQSPILYPAHTLNQSPAQAR